MNSCKGRRRLKAASILNAYPEKDHRPDLNQMVVGAVIDNKGKPVCCEMWPGNTADVKALIPVIDRIRSRFSTGQFCIVANRGMISAENVNELEKRQIPYIFGARMRKVKEIKEDVLSYPGRYREVRPEGALSKDPAPLKVKEVLLNGKRYILCLNPKQVRKDATDRQAIIESLKEKIKTYYSPLHKRIYQSKDGKEEKVFDVPEP